MRIELVENQNIFTKMGFVKTAEGYQPDYDRVTDITKQINLHNA